jgi:beta-glucanase (GH16 family)
MLRRPRAAFRRRATPLVLVLAACAGLAAPAPAPRDAEYRLVWSDEFTGDGPLDSASWGHESGFVRNRELQWYQPENATRAGGLLVIEGRREHRPNPRWVAPSDTSAEARARIARRPWANREFIDYTSASVNTRGRHAWLYGRFAMRARIDVRTGSWPAFWLLGTRGPWPANGEIDVMEFYDDTLLFNVAWSGASAPVWNSRKLPLDRFPAGWAGAFHVWRMDWDERAIRLYLDDSLMNVQDLSRTLNVPHAGAPANPFHSPMYLLINQAIGGQHGGDPSKTTLPLTYEIDWVRVYQTPAQQAATRRALEDRAR